MGFVFAQMLAWLAEFLSGVVASVLTRLFGGTALLAIGGCLSMGCNFVGHMTNNFPPGRNEAGMFWRSTTDLGVYSDTGEGGQEQSSAMIGGSAGKPGDPLALPTEPIPLPTSTDKEPNPSPGAGTVKPNP